MPNQKDDITRLALQAVKDEMLQMQRFATTEDVYEYLMDDSHFKPLSDQLKEAMCTASLCAPGSPDSAFISVLTKSLLKQDQECKRPEKRQVNTVRRWLNGSVRYIGSRSDLIEICFALNLDASQSTELLHKCCHCGFNVRNAEDSIYLYCLLNRRPYIAALELTQKYNEFCKENPLPNESDPQNRAEFQRNMKHSGNTTYQMSQKLLDGSRWNNDEAFFETFLLPNREKFIGYSSYTLKVYYQLKNLLNITIFQEAVMEEGPLAEEKRTDKESGILPEDTRFYDKIYSVIAGIQNPSSPLYSAAVKLGNKTASLPEVLLQIRSIIIQDPGLDAQKKIADTFTSIRSIEYVIAYAVSSIRNENGTFRKKGDSSFKETVVKEFPIDKTFSRFEKDPTSIHQNMQMRKAIILMYFICYSYEFSMYLSDESFESIRFGDMSLEGFMNGSDDSHPGLNQILHRCQLPPLYPANQFDWLILRSISDLGSSIDLENGKSPLSVFNEVLAYSFGEFPDKDETEGE